MEPFSDLCFCSIREGCSATVALIAICTPVTLVRMVTAVVQREVLGGYTVPPPSLLSNAICFTPVASPRINTTPLVKDVFTCSYAVQFTLAHDLLMQLRYRKCPVERRNSRRKTTVPADSRLRDLSPRPSCISTTC